MNLTPQEKEKFFDEMFNVLKDYQQTHSKTLQHIDQSINGYGKGWRLLKTDIGLTITIIVFIVSVITPYFLIKTDIAVMNNKIDTLIKDTAVMRQSNITFSQELGTLSGRISKVEGALGAKEILKANKVE